MPLNKRNSRFVHRTAFCGQTQTITLFVRADDMLEGTQTPYQLFRCRKSMIVKTGEALFGDMSADHHCVWHIPRTELDRIGIAYLNVLTQIRDAEGRMWVMESDHIITVKLFENEIDLDMKRWRQPQDAPAPSG